MSNAKAISKISLLMSLAGLFSCSDRAKNYSSVSVGENQFASNISSSATFLTGSFKTLTKSTYLCAEDLKARNVKADRYNVDSWETLTIVDKNGGDLESGDLVYLRTHSGYFLQVTDGNSELLNARSPNSDTWEQFSIVSEDGKAIKDGSTVGFKSFMTGKFMSAWNGGGEDVRVQGVKFDAWEKFIFHSMGVSNSDQSQEPGQMPISSPPSDTISVTDNLFGDQSPQLNAAIDRMDGSNQEHARLLRYLAAQPTSKWFGGWNTNIEADVSGFMSRAGERVPSLVLYNIPNRDCGHYSAGGAANLWEYKVWIDKVSRGIGTGKAIIVIEPDAVTLQDCLSGSALDDRIKALNYAVNQLKKNSHAKVYLDAGSTDWLSVDEAVSRLKRSGIDSADGFALNTSNFSSTESTASYGRQISAAFSNKNFVIDTSRNGFGPLNKEWCNPRGRALGHPPTLNSGIPGVDAFLWIKRPGESDGECNGGPSAGNFWIEYALELAKNAGV
ncbi:MAG: glycoside hydrolase family 6 protein [Oligoflexus sp.]|nr:glycoside hydrolase family 6 protein [Oligoflexus sp.]